MWPLWGISAANMSIRIFYSLISAPRIEYRSSSISKQTWIFLDSSRACWGGMYLCFSTYLCSDRCVALHHGLASVAPWVRAVHSRAEPGCVCGGGGSDEGGGDALQPPTWWCPDRQLLEDGKSSGSGAHLWPGESVNSRGHTKKFIDLDYIWININEHVVHRQFVQWQQQYCVNEMTGGEDSLDQIIEKHLINSVKMFRVNDFQAGSEFIFSPANNINNSGCFR